MRRRAGGPGRDRPDVDPGLVHPVALDEQRLAVGAEGEPVDGLIVVAHDLALRVAGAPPGYLARLCRGQPSPRLVARQGHNRGRVAATLPADLAVVGWDAQDRAPGEAHEELVARR